jgi:hypothetical protein
MHINVSKDTFVVAVNIDGNTHWVEAPITKEDFNFTVDEFVERIFKPSFYALKQRTEK